MIMRRSNKICLIKNISVFINSLYISFQTSLCFENQPAEVESGQEDNEDIVRGLASENPKNMAGETETNSTPNVQTRHQSHLSKQDLTTLVC